MDLRTLSIQMESDDLAPAIPRKRSRAPSPAASVFTDDSRIQRMPKRLRRNKDVPAYDVAEKAAQALLANPLSRRALKKDAKKARRDAQRASRAQRGGMEVDDGLEGMGLLA
jgi:nuclear GTP-binding protein